MLYTDWKKNDHIILIKICYIHDVLLNVSPFMDDNANIMLYN